MSSQEESCLAALHEVAMITVAHVDAGLGLCIWVGTDRIDCIVLKFWEQAFLFEIQLPAY